MSLWKYYMITVVVFLGFCPDVCAQTLYHAWSQRFGDSDSDSGFGLTVDGAGNVLVTGYFREDVDFGGGSLTSAGWDDIFVAKFDVTGNHIWSQRFGDSDFEQGSCVAVDGAGNVIVTGFFQGSVDFGGGTLTSAGNYDIFVAKFDAAGNHLWSQRFGDTSRDEGISVAVDDAGNVFATGHFIGTVDFGGGTLTSAGIYDIFVAKFDAAGNHLWSQRFGDSDNEYGRGVAVGGSGNVFVTGHFFGSVDFGGGTLTSAGIDDMFVAKFDATGSHLWSQRFGDSDIERGWSVAVDDAGNVIVTGFFQGSVDFGGGTLTSAGSDDVFVAKFDAAGNHLWSQRFGDSDGENGLSVAVDDAGNVFATGEFRGSVDFGGGALTSAGGDDIFVVEFDAGGDHLWSQGFGDIDLERGNSVAVGGAGGVVVTGEFRSSIDFGGGLFTSAGQRDIFVVEFEPGPICDIQPSSIDFSAIEPLAVKDTVITIKNIGSIITIDGDVSESCSYYSIISGDGPFSLASGESLLVTIRYGPVTEGTHVCTIETGDDLCSDVELTGVAKYCQNVPLDVVSWWPMDDIAGSTADDLISGYDGIHHGGPIPILGHVGYALEFDGSNDYVTVPDNPALNITGDVTVELWFKFHGSTNYQLISKGGAWQSPTIDMPSSYVIETNGTNMVVGFESSDGSNFLISSPYPTDGEWHHVAYRRSGNLNELYLDGVLANYGTAAISPGSTAGKALHVGAIYDHNGNYRYLDGVLDEIAVYNRALDASEITAVYVAGAVGKCKDVLPFPQIQDIVDVPDDQGGWVRIDFTRSTLDQVDEESFPIATYDIHRRVDDQSLVSEIIERGERIMEGQYELMLPDGTKRTLSTSNKNSGELLRLENRCYVVKTTAAAGAPPGIWEVVGSVDAQQQDQYTVPAPTLADSAETIPYSVYFVSALTTTPSIYFDSPPDSGYSVDNIAPGVPQSFAVTYIIGSGNQLSWDPSEDEDFNHFVVYRSDNPDLILDPPVNTNWIAVHSTIDTTWLDTSPNGWRYRYQITAVDDTGNESDPASPGTVTAISETEIPKAFALYQNVPNPFNPTTVIHYDVPDAGGRVTLRIYDAAGRLVGRLVDGVQTPGKKRVMWDGRNSRGNRVATGVYFYRMTAAGFTKTRKMVLLQ